MNNIIEDEESYELSYQASNNFKSNDCAIEFLDPSRKNSRKSASSKSKFCITTLCENQDNTKISVGNIEYE